MHYATSCWFLQNFYNLVIIFFYRNSSNYLLGSPLVAQRLKHLPAMQETWVRSLGQEDPLEKEMATHSSILAGESHGRRSLVGYSPWGRKESDTTERLHFLSFFLVVIYSRFRITGYFCVLKAVYPQINSSP